MPPRADSAPDGVARVFALLLALLAAAGLVLAGETEPLGPWPPAVILATSLAVALRWRHGWLFLVPALLPVLDLVPRTGGMFLAEGDQLLLSSALVGYGLLALRPGAMPYRRGAYLSLAGGLLVALMALSYLVAMARGFLPYLPMDEQLAGYHSRWNAPRIGKGFLLALLLLPLLARALREEGEVAVRRLAWGMAAGLVAVCLSALSEKLAYTGFMNFSSDYRITASFWEMNVGGAALDGWLALTLPFSLWAVLRVRQRPGLLALALAFCALAFYVSLVTFSRGVYAAILASALAGGLCRLLWRSPAQAGRKEYAAAKRIEMLVALLVPPVMAWAMWTAFHTGGYRTLLAIVLLVPATHVTAAAGHRAQPWTLMVAALVVLCLVPLEIALFQTQEKGGYLAVAGSAGLCALAAWSWFRRPTSGAAGRLLGLWGALSVGGALVALHWGGEEALWDCVKAEAAFAALLLFHMLRGGSPLSWNVQSGLILAGIAAGLAAAVAISSGYYMGSRFSTSQQDMATRESHWREGISWLNSAEDWMLGKGLGRYPETYYWNSSESGSSGGYAFPRGEDGGHFLRLVSARHALSGGNYLRLLQPLPDDVQGPLTVVADLRPRQTTAYHFEVCQRHLLYAEACIEGRYPLKGDPSQWQQMKLPLGNPAGGHGPFWAHRTSWFGLALESNGDVADVRNLQLLDASGRNLLRNGDFSRQGDFWFQTSDRDHLPWHIKNLLLNMLFDQGALGLTAFCLLYLATAVRMVFRHGDWSFAPFLAASLAGFFTVGLFDSLVDVPRLATLFYLLCFLMFLVRPARLLAPEPDEGHRRERKARA